jgi:hypothetical protein
MLIASTTFILAAVLIVIGLWLKPPVLGAFNLVAILSLVFFGSIMILPRFNASDTMRPWAEALTDLAPPGPDRLFVQTAALGRIWPSVLPFRKGCSHPFR